MKIRLPLRQESFSVSAQSGSGAVYVFKDEVELAGADGKTTTVTAGESAQMTKVRTEAGK